MTQEQALTILKTGANVFLTGEPGSGKTHIVNAYVRWLRARGIEPAITASTGIASTHIGGFTIHSWSGIGIKRYLSPYDLDAIASNKRVAPRIAEAHVLIIDEVSMLSGRTLSMVDAVCREIRKNQAAFGGLQVVVVGDFFQLPPVSKRDFDDTQGSFDESTIEKFAFHSPAWKSLNPLVCYLSEQHRQEDALFLEFLSAVRRGEVAPEHRALLRTRYAPRAKDGITQLYAHNIDVDHINDAELAKRSADPHVFEMTSTGSEKLIRTLVRGCLSPERLVLKEGARVMFTRNDATTHRYVNGTLGTIVEFEYETGFPVVKTHRGTQISAEPTEWRIEENGRALARIIQVPLRLAWAMTVHKSQGMSLDAAHMDLSQTFEYGQGYVALSRVRTLSGLFLAGLTGRALEVHPEIREADKEFRERSAKAQEAFSRMDAEEQESMHSNFVRALGGKEPTQAKKKEYKLRKDASIPKRSLDTIREKYPNAYRPWGKEEDIDLKNSFKQGEKPAVIARAFGRQPGAIRSRLVKLGLLEIEK